METLNRLSENGLDLEQFFLDWKDAIEDVFYHNDSLKAQFLKAQLELFNDDDFLPDLSSAEVEKSIWVFKYLFAYRLFLNEKEIERKLLSLCLAYGKYSDLVELEMNEIRSDLSHTIDHNVLTIIFEKLFAKYESNRILTLNFHLFNRNQLDRLVQVMQGASPKVFFKDELALSEKEIRASYLLKEIPYCLQEFRYTDEYIPRLLVYIKLFALDSEQADFLWNYFRHHTIWEKDFQLFQEEFDFWKKCYQFLLENKDHPDFSGSDQYLDFIIYRKENDLHEFRLYGRTIPNLNELMFAFNNMQHQIYLEEQMKIREASWQADPNLINEIQFKSKTINFIELTSSQELIQEGEKMKNCLMNYIEDCYRGWSKVFSVRDGERTLFDVELRDQRVVQAYGRNNEELNAEFLEMLGVWAGVNKLNLKLE